MAFGSIVLLKGVLHFDRLVHQELAVHALYSLIRSFKRVVEHKAKSF